MSELEFRLRSRDGTDIVQVGRPWPYVVDVPWMNGQSESEWREIRDYVLDALNNRHDTDAHEFSNSVARIELRKRLEQISAKDALLAERDAEIGRLKKRCTLQRRELRRLNMAAESIRKYWDGFTRGIASAETVRLRGIMNTVFGHDRVHEAEKVAGSAETGVESWANNELLELRRRWYGSGPLANSKGKTT